MASTPGSSDFDAKRAELFEALGHPVRMRILEVLDGEGLGFSELKRKVGLESSGHLSFHLAKLGDLLKVNEEGVYVLTGDGHEALRMARTMRAGPDHEWKGLSRPRSIERVVIVGLLIGLVLLGGLALILQQQNATLSNALSNQPGNVTIGGQRYSSVTVPLMPNGTTISLGLVKFTFLIPWTSFILAQSYNLSLNLSPCIGNFSANVNCFTWTIPPEVMVTFSDGTKEYFNRPMIFPSHTQNSSVIVTVQALGFVSPQTNTWALGFVSPQANTWFSGHDFPRAGVLYNSTTEELTFYVSTGTT